MSKLRLSIREDKERVLNEYDSPQDAADRMREIQDAIEELVDEVQGILQDNASDITQKRAESYWIPHILGALRKESGYLGGSMFTMEETIDEMEGRSVDDGD